MSRLTSNSIKEENERHTWKEHKIRLEQLISKSKEVAHSLNVVLNQIKNNFFSKREVRPSCFISYAWPHENYPGEAWLQPFIENLNQHLIQAGIHTILDRRNNRVGGSVYGFIQKLESAENVIVVGSYSLLLKHRIGKSNICAELNKIKEKSKENIFPILLNGDVQQSFPEWFVGYTNVVDWRNDSYIVNLKELIRALYQISLEDESYLSLWQDFERENVELVTGLQEEVVLQLLEEEKKLLNMNIKKSKNLFSWHLCNLDKNMNERTLFSMSSHKFSKSVILAIGLVFVVAVGITVFKKFERIISASVITMKDRGDKLQIDNQGIVPVTVNPVFRKQIQESYQNARKYADKLVFVSIVGFPGTGKTVFSEMYADFVLKNNPHNKKVLRWTIRAEGEGTRIEDYMNLAKSLGLQFHPDIDLQKLTIKVQDKLLEFPGFVIIFDNVINYRDIEGLIPKQPELIGQIILTSQRKDILPFDRIQNSVLVSLNVGMSESEALELLSRLTMSPIDSSTTALIDRLGRIPLALFQAAQFISQSNMSFKNYLELYERELYALLKKDNLPENYKITKESILGSYKLNANYYAIFGFSVHRLSSEAQDILFLASNLSSENIPVTIFEHLNMPKEELMQKLWELEKYSLIQLDNSKKHFSIHRVVQDMARIIISEKKLITDLNAICFDKALALIHKELVEDIVTEHDYYQKRTLLPHLETLLNRQNRPKKYTNSVIRGIFELGLLYKAIGRAKIALSYYQEILPHLNGVEFEFYAEVYKAYGRALQSMGNFVEAKEAYEKSYRLFLSQGTSVTSKIAGILNDLGMVNRDLGTELEEKQGMGAQAQIRSYFIKAKEYLEQSVNMIASLPSQNKNQIRYKTNLAEVYRKLKNFQQAENQLESTLKLIQIEFPDERNRLVASAFFVLGNVYMDKMDYNKAQQFFKKAVSISQDDNVGGALHPLTARHLDALGLAWLKLGNQDEACQHFNAANEIFQASGAMQKQLVQQINEHLLLCRP